jgi:hypothetical protein
MTAKIIGYALLTLLVIYGLGFLATGGDLIIYKFWAPKQAAAERQVFEQTPSYVKGQVQELENMQLEYSRTTDPNAKSAIAGIILHRASGFNLNDPDVPQSLRTFISQLKDGQ